MNYFPTPGILVGMKQEFETHFLDHLQGCPLSFETLTRAMAPSVYRFFRRMGAQAIDAEDLSQEFFARLHRSASTFRRGAAFRPWAWEIARNIYFRHRARQVNRNVIYLRDWMTSQLAEPQAGSSSNPEEIMDSRLSLESLLGTLSQEKRIVLELKHFQGLKFREIAEILSIPEGTVKTRLFHALKELKAHMDSRKDGLYK